MLAYNTGVYNLLKFLHISGSVAWVGTGFAAQVLVARVLKADDPPRLAALARDIGWMGKTVLAPLSGTVALLGVVIADSFVVRRGTYAASEFFDGARRWRWSAFASWIPGAALYFLIVVFALPIGATLPSFALAAGLHVVLSRVESALTRPTSVAASGDP